MPKKRSPFGELIHNARISSGLSNKEFAALCGTSTVQLWRWENGHRTPTIGAAASVLRRLGKTMTIG